MGSQQVYLQVRTLCAAALAVRPPLGEVLVVIRLWTPALWTKPGYITAATWIYNRASKEFRVIDKKSLAFRIKNDYSWKQAGLSKVEAVATWRSLWGSHPCRRPAPGGWPVCCEEALKLESGRNWTPSGAQQSSEPGKESRSSGIA